jgi:putative transposase
MPRRRRLEVKAQYFHVVNRSVRQSTIFRRPSDYRAFLTALEEGLNKYPVRLLAYCVLGNHWHLIVEPKGTLALARFMQWVTSTHAVRWHHHRDTIGKGPVYQGRYFSRPVEGVADLVHVCRYVERNALRAGLVRRAQDWPWCSLADRLRPQPRVTLHSAPFLASASWIEHVNTGSSLRDEIKDRMLEQALEAQRRLLGRPTSGTKTAKTVEKGSDPFNAADEPGAGKGRDERRGVRRRADEDQADAHVERAKHLRVVNPARALQPREQRRHRPALAIK